MEKHLDIIYKKVEGRNLYLDIYVPDEKNAPLVLWTHGGGWRSLNRKWNLVMPLVERGYAVASADYRYSDEEIFPAQMYDLKEALLYLKKHGAEYGYDASKIAVAGDSAGGHLAEMLGVSIGNKNWEREDEDYSVQAVIDFSGAVKLCNPKDTDCFSQLVGARLGTKTYTERVSMARPVNYIDGSEPPFLILHGSSDTVVSMQDPRSLRNALEDAGVPVHMYLVPGGEHGLSGKLVDDIVCEFLGYYLKGQKTVITPEVKEIHQRTVPVVKK